MNNSLKDICVIVVFYNPTQDQITNIELLAKKICLICIDNSPCTNNTNIDNYFPQYRNTGIAHAQNIGIKEAKNRGFKDIVFFDQDSKVSIDFIYQMKHEYDLIKKIDLSFGILGPLVIEEETNKEYKNTSDRNADYSMVSDVISSGMIVSINTIDKIGELDEKLFIDYVDCEWCWRAKQKGISTYMTRKVTLQHTVGKKHFTFLNIHFEVSSAFRYFYQYRNVIWLLSRPYPPKKWKIKSVIRLIIDFIIIPFLSKEHLAVSKNMVIGLFDGLFKKQINESQKY